MSRVFFAADLDTAASWWRIYRTDGVALAFTTHDRDLWFEGHLHRAAPGLLPSAIRRTIDLSDDEAEVDGALSHDTITSADIATGKYDGAGIEMGIVDWETLETASLYAGSIDSVAQDSDTFSARLKSVKSVLAIDTVPRTSPTCRAEFCGPGCSLSPERFRRRARVSRLDAEGGRVWLSIADPGRFEYGTLRWIDGPHSGRTVTILSLESDGAFMLDTLLDKASAPGDRAILHEGCDKTISTCARRFDNAKNFRGEPHLPGNDLLAQYPQPR
ncbi:DUF2163 domain-containing protein [Erythrobacter litoralis]|uniref:DUF2163 domain-containing protein n=1 Tax=Erythrobacter litoralis TaxID=39960 RepID=UPI00243610E9|nr:DUF2163 domain-containing protein [Erythrobacter litoralis]MDG6079189.1 DUF2163 domain-containing protein [Erythrobacter litoralis]